MVSALFIFQAILVVWLFEHLIAGAFFWYHKSFNIPIAILRFTGNKERPLLVLTKGKKRVLNGVPRLIIRGYKGFVRDYLSENYYPCVRGKYGGLILWEFEDGMLTPSIPIKKLRKMTRENAALVSSLLEKLGQFSTVKFEYDEQLHKELKLKAVDDVDVEFMLQEAMRVEGQYSGGLQDFLNKYAGHIAVVMVMLALVVIVALVLKEMPEMMAECANAARGVVQDSILKQAAAAAAPPA